MRKKVELIGEISGWTADRGSLGLELRYEIHPFNDTSDVAGAVRGITINTHSSDKRTMKALDEVTLNRLRITLEWID